MLRDVGAVDVGPGHVEAAFSWDGQTLAIGLASSKGNAVASGTIIRFHGGRIDSVDVGPVLGIAAAGTRVHATTADAIVTWDGGSPASEANSAAELTVGPNGELAYAKLDPHRPQDVTGVHLARAECRHSLNTALSGARSITSLAWSATGTLAIVSSGLLYVLDASPDIYNSLLGAIGGVLLVRARGEHIAARRVVWAGAGAEERLFVLQAGGRVRRLDADQMQSTYPVSLPGANPWSLRRFGSEYLCIESEQSLIVWNPSTLSEVARVQIPGQLLAVSAGGTRVAVRSGTRVEIHELEVPPATASAVDPNIELIARTNRISEFVAKRDATKNGAPLTDFSLFRADAGVYGLTWSGWMRSSRASEALAAAADLDEAIREQLARTQPATIDFSHLVGPYPRDSDVELLGCVAQAIRFGEVDRKWHRLTLPGDTETRLAYIRSGSIATWLESRRALDVGFTLLDDAFVTFAELPQTSKYLDASKSIVRRIAQQIRTKFLTLSDDELGQCRRSELALPRITAYLYAELGRTDPDSEDRRSFVAHEWDRHQRTSRVAGAAELASMPLEHAIRCYAAALKAREASAEAAEAAVDRGLLSEIRDKLAGAGEGHESVLKTIAEIERHFEGDAQVESEPRVDIGVLTIRIDELRAVLERFPDEEGPGLINKKREYNIRRADAGNGKSYRVAIIRQSETGNGEALDAARDLIEDLAPRLLIVVGIAGGVPHDDFSLGDVIISTRIIDYSVEARKEGKEPAYALTGGPIHRSLQASIVNLPAREAALAGWTDDLPAKPPVDTTDAGLASPTVYGESEDWQKDVRASLRRHFAEHPRTIPTFQDGAIATSDKLVKDTSTLVPWLATARQILAVEMESGGVYRAARDRVMMVAIRGLSDIVGYKRNDLWTKYACKSAAAFTAAFLRTTPIDVF